MKNNTQPENLYFVIMAGGVGARFWPASRESLPKQFLDILGTGRSLLQMTFDRISPLAPPDRIIILTHEKYKEKVARHLPDLPVRNILTEPARRNTAPCIAYVSLHIAARDPRASMVILPADHLITREEVFRTVILDAVHYADRHPEILTLGMKPHRPDTGYGYIRLGEITPHPKIFSVRSFTEKPDLPVAREYLASGEHMWNAGIFVSTAQTMIDAFQNHAPEIYQTLHASDIFGTPEEADHIAACYGDSPSISLDFAIMEKAKNIVCMPVDIGWSDVGTWKSLYDLQQQGGISSNIPPASLEIQESGSLQIYGSDGKKYLIKGLDKMIIVDREDVLMIWPLEEEQEIKNIREKKAPQWKLE